MIWYMLDTYYHFDLCEKLKEKNIKNKEKIMKKILHLTAVMLVLCALLSAMTGCSGNGSGNGDQGGSGSSNTGTGNQGGDSGTSTAKVEYTVSVKTIGSHF